MTDAKTELHLTIRRANGKLVGVKDLPVGSASIGHLRQEIIALLVRKGTPRRHILELVIEEDELSGDLYGTLVVAQKARVKA